MYVTALPIIMYAVFDKDVLDHVALTSPELYLHSSQGLFFTQQIFWSWIAAAVWETLVIFTFSSFCLVNGGNLGEDENLWVIGMLTFFMVMLVANLRVAIEFNIWQWPQLLALLFGFFSYFSTGFLMEMEVVAPLLDLQYLSLFRNALRLPAFWLGVILCPWIVLFPTVAYKVIKRQSYPELYHILGEQGKAGIIPPAHLGAQQPSPTSV